MPAMVDPPGRSRVADSDVVERHRVAVDVHVLLTRGDRVLLLRRSADAEYAASLFTAPSGHVEQGEDVLAAAVREVREETGVELTEAMLRFVHVTHHRGPGVGAESRIGWFFHATGWPGARYPQRHQEPVNAEPHKHSELVWARIDDLPADTVAYVYDAVAALRAGHVASTHFQEDRDTVAHDPDGPRVLRAIPVPDTAGAALRRELGVVAPPRIGAPWTWHGGVPVPEGLPVAQSLGWLFDPRGRVLLVVDADGTVTLPGGGVEAGDADAFAALVREADEEAAAELRAGPGAWLGYLLDQDGVIYGHRPCARARFAARLGSLGPARPDPATGTTWGRLLVPPRMAAALLGWDDGLAEALAAQDAAFAAWGLPRNESWEAEEVPPAGLAFDPPAPRSDRAVWVAGLPRVLACAAVLFRDGRGRVLLCAPTYRDDEALLLPGGSVEASGETPREAAEREVAEELGVRLPVGRLLATDWTTGPDRPPLHVSVFDGGVLSDEDIAALRPGADGEVASVVWADARLGVAGLAPGPARRINAALMAAETGAGTLELAHGRITGVVCTAGSRKQPATPAAARRALAQRLADAGHLPDPRWHTTVERFPRERLFPGAWVPRALPRTTTGQSAAVPQAGWIHVDAAGGKGRAELAWHVASGTPLVTELDGAQRLNGARLYTSSPRLTAPGMPRLLAALHALDPSHATATLVVGAGTGLGTGMLHTYLTAHRDAHRLVAVADPDDAEALTERLVAAGIEVPVIGAPSAPGLPDRLLPPASGTGASGYDRILIETPVDHVPVPWLRLLADQGRLVAFLRPTRHADPALLVLDRTAHGITGTLTPLPPEPAAHRPAPNPVTTGPTGVFVLTSSYAGPAILRERGFTLALAHLAPHLTWTTTAPVHVHDAARGSTSVLHRHGDRWSARHTGGSRPWSTLLAVHRMWQAASSPDQYQVTAAEDGTLTACGGPGLMWSIPPGKDLSDTARGGDR